VIVSGEAIPATEIPARTANLAGLVLANLVGNAIEASPPGASVTLTARELPGAIEFLVRDCGPGISGDRRAQLFQPVRSSKIGGGGIGLAISRQIARHAGGELDLAQSDNHGSVFRLRVPRPS
jgi:signal transduction histidine kinase